LKAGLDEQISLEKYNRVNVDIPRKGKLKNEK
jgi:hypothetical protein